MCLSFVFARVRDLGGKKSNFFTFCPLRPFIFSTYLVPYYIVVNINGLKRQFRGHNLPTSLQPYPRGDELKPHHRTVPSKARTTDCRPPTDKAMSVQHNDTEIEVNMVENGAVTSASSHLAPLAPTPQPRTTTRRDAPTTNDAFNDNRTAAHNTNENDAENEDGEDKMSMEELIYGASSFHAIVKPGKLEVSVLPNQSQLLVSRVLTDAPTSH